MPHRSKSEREIPVFSASTVLSEIGRALTDIRLEDGLTFADLARVLGVSEDMAAKYCAGSAAMNVVTFGSGKREWNGRFTGAFDRLCADSRPTGDSDRGRGNKVLKAALALSLALDGDDEIPAELIRKNRGTIENARDALDDILRKLVRAA